MLDDRPPVSLRKFGPAPNGPEPLAVEHRLSSLGDQKNRGVGPRRRVGVAGVRRRDHIPDEPNATGGDVSS